MRSTTLIDRASVILSSERLLVVMPGYAAPRAGEPFGDGKLFGNAVAAVLTTFRSRRMREHVHFYRDFYANPRSSSYMLERLQELIGERCGQTMLLVGPGSQQVHAPWATEIRRLPALPQQALTEIERLQVSHDAVLLVHADALGLGLAAIERTLSKGGPGRVFVLNGRRRFYRLDRAMQRVLARHRLLAHTRLVESALGLLVTIAGTLLAAMDRLFTSKKA